MIDLHDAHQYTLIEDFAGWAIPVNGPSAESDLEVAFTVNTSYAASPSSVKLTTTPQVIPVTQTLLIKNLYCSDSQNFTAEIVLTNGTTSSETGIDVLQFTLPAGAANVTITNNDIPGPTEFGLVVVLYYGTGGLTASVGSDSEDAPSVNAVSAITLNYCDDDD